MRLLEAALRSASEFVVGDDWRTAVGVIATLALTAIVAQSGLAAWWVVPVGVVALLALSIRRAMRLR
ncbi:MAG TPA: hypothetical protein VG188_08120 [Solirubrobacteraceae bacterium]|nr:hypothetical protein [Solirubrobacteraceae bacterium]